MFTLLFPTAQGGVLAKFLTLSHLGKKSEYLPLNWLTPLLLAILLLLSSGLPVKVTNVCVGVEVGAIPLVVSRLCPKFNVINYSCHNDSNPTEVKL